MIFGGRVGLRSKHENKPWSRSVQQDPSSGICATITNGIIKYKWQIVIYVNRGPGLLYLRVLDYWLHCTRSTSIFSSDLGASSGRQTGKFAGFQQRVII